MSDRCPGIAPDGRNDREPALFQAVRQAEVIAPDERSITKFMPYVCISPEARDALVEVVEAAQALDKTWKAHGFTHNHIPDALTLSEALEPLVKE